MRDVDQILDGISSLYGTIDNSTSTQELFERLDDLISDVKTAFNSKLIHVNSELKEEKDDETVQFLSEKTKESISSNLSRDSQNDNVSNIYDVSNIDASISESITELRTCEQFSVQWYDLYFELCDLYCSKYEDKDDFDNRTAYLNVKIDYFNKKIDYLKKFESSSSDYEIKLSKAQASLEIYQKKLNELNADRKTSSAVSSDMKFSSDLHMVHEENANVNLKNDAHDPMSLAIQEFLNDHPEINQVSNEIDPMQKAIDEFVASNSGFISNPITAKIDEFDKNVRKVNSFNPFKKRKIVRKKKRKITEQENINTMYRVRKKISEIFQNISKNISPDSDESYIEKRR